MIDTNHMQQLYWLAEKLHAAGIFSSEVSTADRAFAVILAGEELGFAPVQSARAFAFVKNKISLSADAQIGLCMRHRDVCLYFRVVESTAARAIYETQRAGSPEPTRLEYTIEQARSAGLTKSATWTAHPAAMLRARCGAALARAVYPDLVGGMYDPDEVEEIRRQDGIPQSPEAAPRQSAQPRVDPNDAALETYRARLAAVQSGDALVAVVLELAPSMASCRDAAWKIAQERGERLDVDLRKAVTEAHAITSDPAHWKVVAQVLAQFDAATTVDGVKAAAKTHGGATNSLPEALRARLNLAYKARCAALTPPAAPANDSVAALLEDEIRRAETIPALDAVHDKIASAVQSKALAPDEAKALVDLYNRAVDALERSEAAA